VEYQTDDLEQLTLSYAISVHKSQGNEYPVVIMPVTTQHFLMLQRNLIYTAVTRAKKMVVLLGTKRAIAIAVKNNRIEERNSFLNQRLNAVMEGS
jgi:exodeoxyribonuclease V alpha subunit